MRTEVDGAAHGEGAESLDLHILLPAPDGRANLSRGFDTRTLALARMVIDSVNQENDDATEDDEKINLELLHARDPREMRKVFRLATPYIRAAVGKFATDSDDADDLIQECWIQIEAQLDKFKKAKSFKGWAVVVSLNYCRQKYRTAKRAKKRAEKHSKKRGKRGSMRTTESKHTSERTSKTVRMDDLGDVLSGGPQPDEVLRVRELQEAVWEALGDLPDREREAVVLKYGEGRSTAHVAKELGVSAPSARKLVRRALCKLHKREDLRDLLTP